MNRRLAALFLTAVLGVLLAVGLLLTQLGPAVVTAYVVIVAGGLALLARRARALRTSTRTGPSARLAAGRTCSCCTSSVHDPVQVI